MIHNKKSSVMVYIILASIVAAVSIVIYFNPVSSKPDLGFVGEAAISLYRNENEVFSQLLFIQSAAHYSLQEALADLSPKMSPCDKYGTYPLWKKDTATCFPAKVNIDEALKKEFLKSFKLKLDGNSWTTVKPENYEYSIINADHLIFLGIATVNAKYDVSFESKKTVSIITLDETTQEFVPFSCAAQSSQYVCRLRRETYKKLQQAETAARSSGNELVINSAYRSKEDQAKLCGTIINGKCSNRNAAVPGESSHEIGGAVDVRLVVNDNRNACGTIDIRDKPKLYDYADAKDPIGIQIHECRKELKRIMTNAGFVNLESEWWHWEYGTVMWAKTTSKEPLYIIA